MRAEGSAGFGMRAGVSPGIGGGGNPQTDPFAAADARETRCIGGVLQWHYPGHPWFVEVSHKAGVVVITLPGFGKWSYVVHINTLKSDPGYRSIVRACGHLLERLNMPRRGYNADHWHDAMRSPIIGRNRRYGPPGG